MHVPEEVTLTVSVSKKFVYRQRCRRGRTLSTDMFRHGVDEGSHGAKARKMSVIHLDNGGGGTLSGGGVIHGMCTELKILSRDHTILQWFFGTTTPPAAAVANAWFAYRVERRYAELPR